MKTEAQPIDMLLVDDNPGDVRLTQEVLRDSKLINRLCVVTDGEQAMDFLKRRSTYTGAIRPDLVLLDLNLPRKNGREVLSEIKTDPDLKRIPVVILTSSQAEEDVLKSYDMHANCYITKPVDLDQFVQVVKSIENFWVSIVKLPAN